LAKLSDSRRASAVSKFAVPKFAVSKFAVSKFAVPKCAMRLAWAPMPVAASLRELTVQEFSPKTVVGKSWRWRYVEILVIQIGSSGDGSAWGSRPPGCVEPEGLCLQIGSLSWIAAMRGLGELGGTTSEPGSR